MTSEAEDGILVARARDGDTAAFEDLVRRYATRVYRIALRIVGDADTAEDAAQDSFITAWRCLHEIHAEQAFAAWLYRIAATRAVNVARTRRPEISLEEEALPPSRAAGPAQQAVAAELRAALTCALRRLTPEQRACWVLRELEGMSTNEIARTVHTSPDAVRGRVHRARARLAQELTPWR
ncbi:MULTISPECIES: sigma-70 family RNA polymerase sigma factor [unclassified Streptomyces]|uniref:RNA polymerase sigma factor n=1 Tax=unclassified Streptomyces TaxID=2593676 RepID=UPI00336A37CF